MKKSITKFSTILLIACSVSVFIYLNFYTPTLPVDYQGISIEQIDADSSQHTIILPDLDILEKALNLGKQGLPYLSRF